MHRAIRGAWASRNREDNMDNRKRGRDGDTSMYGGAGPSKRPYQGWVCYPAVSFPTPKLSPQLSGFG